MPHISVSKKVSPLSVALPHDFLLVHSYCPPRPPVHLAGGFQRIGALGRPVLPNRAGPWFGSGADGGVLSPEIARQRPAAVEGQARWAESWRSQRRSQRGRRASWG
jgi:hypothetical protein